jgi:hypothetical protein
MPSRVWVALSSALSSASGRLCRPRLPQVAENGLLGISDRADRPRGVPGVCLAAGGGGAIQAPRSRLCTENHEWNLEYIYRRSTNF